MLILYSDQIPIGSESNFKSVVDLVSRYRSADFSMYIWAV